MSTTHLCCGGRLGEGELTAGIMRRGGGVSGLPSHIEIAASSTWERLESKTSQATVFVPWRCCDLLDGIRSWEHELAVLWSGEPVWCGPITRVRPSEYGATVSALDLSAHLGGRRLPTLEHVGASATQVAEDYVTTGLAEDTSPNITVDRTASPITVDRFVHSDDHMVVSAALATLDDVVSWTMIGRTMHVCCVTGQSSGVRLDADSFEAAPELEDVGIAKATRVVVVGGSSDPAGAPVVGIAGNAAAIARDGLIELVVRDREILDAESATAKAQSLLTSRLEPIAVDPGSGATLRPTAPVCVHELRPGRLFWLDAGDSCRKVSQQFKLTKVRGVGPSITVTLELVHEFSSGA